MTTTCEQQQQECSTTIVLRGAQQKRLLSEGVEFDADRLGSPPAKRQSTTSTVDTCTDSFDDVSQPPASAVRRQNPNGIMATNDSTASLLQQQREVYSLVADTATVVGAESIRLAIDARKVVNGNGGPAGAALRSVLTGGTYYAIDGSLDFPAAGEGSTTTEQSNSDEHVVMPRPLRHTLQWPPEAIEPDTMRIGDVGGDVLASRPAGAHRASSSFDPSHDSETTLAMRLTEYEQQLLSRASQQNGQPGVEQSLPPPTSAVTGPVRHLAWGDGTYPGPQQPRAVDDTDHKNTAAMIGVGDTTPGEQRSLLTAAASSSDVLGGGGVACGIGREGAAVAGEKRARVTKKTLATLVSGMHMCLPDKPRTKEKQKKKEQPRNQKQQLQQSRNEALVQQSCEELTPSPPPPASDERGQSGGGTIKSQSQTPRERGSGRDGAVATTSIGEGAPGIAGGEGAVGGTKCCTKCSTKKTAAKMPAKMAMKTREPYRCGKCGQLKNKHMCPFKNVDVDVRTRGMQTTSPHPDAAVEACDSPVISSSPSSSSSVGATRQEMFSENAEKLQPRTLQPSPYLQVLVNHDEPTGRYGEGVGDGASRAVAHAANGSGSVSVRRCIPPFDRSGAEDMETDGTAWATERAAAGGGGGGGGHSNGIFSALGYTDNVGDIPPAFYELPYRQQQLQRYEQQKQQQEQQRLQVQQIEHIQQQQMQQARKQHHRQQQQHQQQQQQIGWPGSDYKAVEPWEASQGESDDSLPASPHRFFLRNSSGWGAVDESSATSVLFPSPSPPGAPVGEATPLLGANSDVYEWRQELGVSTALMATGEWEDHVRVVNPAAAIALPSRLEEIEDMLFP